MIGRGVFVCCVPHVCTMQWCISHIFVCRECAVKYNSYFEFPRKLDMSPYTAATLAKLEGYVHLLYIKRCIIRLLFM